MTLEEFIGQFATMGSTQLSIEPANGVGYYRTDKSEDNLFKVRVALQGRDSKDKGWKVYTGESTVPRKDLETSVLALMAQVAMMATEDCKDKMDPKYLPLFEASKNLMAGCKDLSPDDFGVVSVKEVDRADSK